MIIDARSLPAGIVVQTGVCIIGAGAAGITLAREFSNARFPVVLLESGGMDYEPETQELYEGRSIGSPFQDLTASRSVNAIASAFSVATSDAAFPSASQQPRRILASGHLRRARRIM